ncbi:hypothetical protein AYO49_03435 [Verrucomicrobiaceae bacterium SCGC AG-212-N21]|nr:hypothetical protein AYO49_03435 [Verrucomicrobiaceae bacterium SCGC AG-212-N21]
MAPRSELLSSAALPSGEDKPTGRLTLASGILAILLGLTVMAGWLLRSPTIVRLHPSYAPMQFLTAVNFLLSGVALTALGIGRRRVTLALGLIVGTIGILVSAEHLLGARVGFDWIVQQLPSLPDHPALKPAPPSAVCFALCGAALTILSLSRLRAIHRPVVWVIGSLAISVSSVALMGYTVGLAGTYVWGQFTGMAIHTAIGVCLLAFGLLAATSRAAGHGHPQDDPWFPVPFGIAGVSSTILLWQALLTDPHPSANANASNAAAAGDSRAVATWDAAEESQHNKLAHLILFFGLGCTALLVTSLHALRQIRVQSRSTALANEKLQAEIEERIEAQERLSESEERLQVVLDSATGVAVIGTDTSGLITYFSKGAEKLLGYTSEEMVGKQTPVIIHDAAEVAKRSEELTAGLGRKVAGMDVFLAMPQAWGSERREWIYVCRDGSRVAVELTVTVVAHAAPNGTAYLGTAVDITERKRLVEQLRDLVRTEKNSRALLDAASRIAKLGHWELPAGGAGPKWSERSYEIHEVTPGTAITLEQAIGFYSAEERFLIERCVEKAFLEGEPFDFEARLTTAKGRCIWVHARGEPVWDETSGKVVSLRGVLQDVDEQHQAAELLTRRNWELEMATAEAQAHARAKAEFLANMSHEIRTPLNAIIGMSELLNDDAMSPRQLEYVNTIRLSGDALLGIINNILDFSKIEAGHLELERVPLDLHECVESAFDLVAAQAAKKKLDLLYWIEPSVPGVVLGDPTRFRQILVNLLTNGVKFTDKGEVLVRISTVEDSDAPMMRVSVRDTGIGISAEGQKRLFQSFSQVDSSTSRRYGGTGLGLAICQRLVSLMGGRIWVDSSPGHGAEFQFELPLQAAEMTSPRVYQRGETTGLEGLRVMIVDDNETNRWILEAQIKMWGMVPRSAAHPNEALGWVERGDPFDLAILDGHMPELSGFELAEKLSQHPSAVKLPILVLTSVGDSSGKSPKAGVSGVLTKPMKKLALYEAVSKLLLGGPERVKASSKATQNWAVQYPLKILVAEDNPVNQRVIALLLEKLGYRAEIVANGLEVLAALQRKPFDVLLMDVQMPEMDGVQAAREICRLYAREERPCMVALTANAISGDRDTCLAAGMDAYLSKPVRSDELAAALRDAYESTRIQSETVEAAA